MSWKDYFDQDGRNLYHYKDYKVVTLPSNLPMPPVTDMRYMFDSCYSLQDITALAKWDVSNVTDMSHMFCSCHSLQNISALANWDVSNVTNMRGMFYECRSLHDFSPLSSWDTCKVTNVVGMFYGCGTNVDLTPLLGHLLRQYDDHNGPITGSPTIMFRWEIDQLKAHIARLEKQIAELTNIIEQHQKEKSTAWYQPIISLFSAD